MASCSCGAPAPALEGLGEWQTVTDLNASRIVALLTGELDQARCEAGCQLGVQASVMFRDSAARRRYVAPGYLVSAEDAGASMLAECSDDIEILDNIEELRRVVEDMIDRRASVFLSMADDGVDGAVDVEYMHGKWRLFTASVMAAVKVSLTVPTSRAKFHAYGSDADRGGVDSVFGRRQVGIWASMLDDWTSGAGVGSFEEDLAEYVDRTSFIVDPLRFAEDLDDLLRPEHEEFASMDMYRREALRASLYARVGQPNPYEDRWALVWLWWELRFRLSGYGGVATVPAMAVSAERVRRTISPDAARYAGGRLMNKALVANKDGSMSAQDGDSMLACLQDVFLEVGFDEEFGSLPKGMRLQHPIDEVADIIIDGLRIDDPDMDGFLTTAEALAQTLVEARRIDDLKRVVDAMRETRPARSVEINLWYYLQLLEMNMPKQLLKEAGERPAPHEKKFAAAARRGLLQLRAEALRRLGRPRDALVLLDSAPHEVLDEPSGRQTLGIARADLALELGSPGAALAQLEALLSEVDDPLPSLYTSLATALLRFGRYAEAADHAHTAYTRALRDPMTLSVGRMAAHAMWCQALDDQELDAGLVNVATNANQPPDPERDHFAAMALLTRGIAESDAAQREFLDRVRTESEAVLQQALAEQDHHMASIALYGAALHDQVYRPDNALYSWTRMMTVLAGQFNVGSAVGSFYLAANLLTIGKLAVARTVLKREMGSTGELGHDSELRTAALSGGHSAREIDLLTAAMFAAPDTTQADLRLVAEFRRGVASRAIRRSHEEPAWRQHGLDDDVVVKIAPDHGRVGVLEWVSDSVDTRALITVVDAAGSVSGTTVALPDVDLSRLAMRMRSRLSTWRTGRAGTPFDVAEWQVCRTWLDRLLDDHLAPDDHLVVIPFAGWRHLPWHTATFDRVTCSYEPSWVALLSTVTGTPSREHWREGVVAVPKVGDSAEIIDAMAQYVGGCGNEVRVLDGVAADRAAVTELLGNVDLATLLTHGYTSTAETEVALMLAADGSLPLAHSVAASSERGRSHRFGWREYAELAAAPRVILSAACSTGGGHIVGLGEHLGLYNVLRQVGLRAFVAPQWDIVASEVLPIFTEIRTLLLKREAGLGQCVRQAVRQAIRHGTPAWSAHALILEGDWR